MIKDTLQHAAWESSKNETQPLSCTCISIVAHWTGTA